MKIGNGSKEKLQISAKEKAENTHNDKGKRRCEIRLTKVRTGEQRQQTNTLYLHYHIIKYKS